MRMILSILLVHTMIHLNAQYKKTASCIDVDFDKKVNSYLSYSAPVLGVAHLYAHASNYTILDAREWEEYSVSHLENSKFIGYDDFNMELLKNVPKEANIVVYCSIGYRSEKIAKKLKKAGYKNVFNLYGSIFEWVNNGYDIIDNQGKKTQKLHTYNKDWGKWVKNPNIQKIY